MSSPDNNQITAQLNSLEEFHRITPYMNRRKVMVLLVAAFGFLLFVGLRFWVGISPEDGIICKMIPGLSWYETERVLGNEHIPLTGWEWPTYTYFAESMFEFTIGLDTIIDMLAAGAVSAMLAVLLGLASLKEATKKRYVLRGVSMAIFFAILVYTFHWCNIDPFGVWQSRSNAWRHLAGKTFNDKELAEIRTDAERAPEYFAEGEANYIVSSKYKDVPAEQNPSAFAKQKEVRQTKSKILAKMTPEQRAEMIDEEYARLIDKKRGGYWPPEMSPKRLWVYLTALLETIAIAIWASILAVACAIPFSMLAARNTLELIAPGDSLGHRSIRWFSVFVVRRFMDSCRGFNELVMALIFVSVIGLGPFAGILALWVHTTGVLGKVFSEAIEAIDPGQVEALVGTGSGCLQTISFAVMPQIMPIVISYSLLRFESNVRSAAILGWVGAGGIGFLLQDKMVGYAHREVCTMMIMIIVAVSMIDFFCGKLRRRFI